MKQKQNRHLNLSQHHLRVYAEARKLARLVHAKPPSHASLRKHACEASVSVGLNIGEGAGLEGGARKRHYKIAKGSVVETVVAYELASDIGEHVPLEQVQELGSAIAGMLAVMIKR